MNNILSLVKISFDFAIMFFAIKGIYLNDINNLDTSAMIVLLFSVIIMLIFGHAMIQSDQNSLANKVQLLPKNLVSYVYLFIFFNIVLAGLLYYEYYIVSFAHINSGAIFLYARSRILEVNNYVNK